MFDTSLLITVALIFLVTLIGSYLRSRRKDPCLRSFEGFHVTLERASNKIVWGILALESTGMELCYRDDVQDVKHLESSYILYASEYDDIEAIFRFADELSPANKKKRAADIKRSFHPGAYERAKRNLRKFVGTASDSINEVIGLLVGRARKPAGRYITPTGETYLNKLGTNLIGQVGGVFDPLMEHYIGQKVVVEVMEGSEVHEHVGIFKNYSPDFVEILDVQFPQKQALKVGPDGCIGSECVQVSLDEKGMRVHNPGDRPVLLQSLRLKDEEQLLNVVVDSNEEVELFPEKRFQRAELHVRVVRELDMVIPRTRCLVRHRAERFQPELLTDVIFDMGFILNPTRRQLEQERRLREELEKNPQSALAAANLGGLLLQRKAYDEAKYWLEHALTMEYSLPDNGRRARMQLRELKRRLEKLDRVALTAAMNEASSVATSGGPTGGDANGAGPSQTTNHSRRAAGAEAQPAVGYRVALHNAEDELVEEGEEGTKPVAK